MSLKPNIFGAAYFLCTGACEAKEWQGPWMPVFVQFQPHITAVWCANKNKEYICNLNFQTNVACNTQTHDYANTWWQLCQFRKWRTPFLDHCNKLFPELQLLQSHFSASCITPWIRISIMREFGNVSEEGDKYIHNSCNCFLVCQHYTSAEMYEHCVYNFGGFSNSVKAVFLPKT